MLRLAQIGTQRFKTLMTIALKERRMSTTTYCQPLKRANAKRPLQHLSQVKVNQWWIEEMGITQRVRAVRVTLAWERWLQLNWDQLWIRICTLKRLMFQFQLDKQSSTIIYINRQSRISSWPFGISKITLSCWMNSMQVRRRYLLIDIEFQKSDRTLSKQ